MFLLLVVGVIAIAIGVARSSRRNRLAAQQATQVDAERAAHAAQEANRQLLSADEQVRTATDELNYARAQFGLNSTDEFARAIEAGKAAVSRGFSAQGQMNSATAPAEQLRLATAIMQDLGANMNPLSAIQASFATKRAEQASLPERIAEARERLAEELTDLERAKSELASISTLYPAQMLASLQDNPEQASALLTSARTALDILGHHRRQRAEHGPGGVQPDGGRRSRGHRRGPGGPGEHGRSTRGPRAPAHV